MNFGGALEALKSGAKVAREGWNGKNMWVRMVDNIESFFVIKNVKGSLNTWVPSISDLLADDWSTVE